MSVASAKARLEEEAKRAIGGGGPAALGDPVEKEREAMILRERERATPQNQNMGHDVALAASVPRFIQQPMPQMQKQTKMVTPPIRYISVDEIVYDVKRIQVHTFREQKVAKYVDEERRISIPRHQHHLDVGKRMIPEMIQTEEMYEIECAATDIEAPQQYYSESKTAEPYSNGGGGGLQYGTHASTSAITSPAMSYNTPVATSMYG